MLLGEALTVVAVKYVLSSRNEHEDEDAVERRQRHIWIHAIVSEAVSFMIDQIILQRRRAEVAIERASLIESLPSSPLAAAQRLPRQPRHSSSRIEA